jgi:Ca-activated chloride channel family protein
MTLATLPAPWTESFNLGDPVWLHALWVAPLILLTMAISFHRARRLLHRLAEPEMLARLTASVSWPRRWLKAALVSVSAALLAFTLTQPQWGVESRTVEQRGRDLVFVIDVSRSMLARDLAPNRLERAKVWMKDLVNTLEGDRAGIVAFAGAPVVRSPLTMDRDFLSLAIDELSPDVAPRGGTLIGDAIRKAVSQVFALDPEQDRLDERAPFRDIILITDGEDQDSFPVEAARAASTGKES